MLICIDSSALVVGLQGKDPSATKILELVGSDLNLIIPRLIAQEVTRNLTSPQQVRQFYQLFQNYSFAQIIDEPVPLVLVEKYVNLGLPAKADAFIGAFADMTNLSERVDELLYADFSDYLKNLEDYEEKLVRGEIQDYTVKIHQED